MRRPVIGSVRTGTALRVAAILVVAASLSACGKSPTKVFDALQEAARKGDAEAFATGFSAESQPFARALLALYDSQYPAGSPSPRPLEQLTLSEAQSETIEGDKAKVVVAAKGGTPVTLIFVREGGAWKLDVRLTDKNARDLSPDDE